MTWPPSATDLAVVALAILASISDLRRRRVPNSLTVGAACVGIGMNAVLFGCSGVLLALAGWGAGLLLLFPFYALGGMGAGDVKLLGAFGAWLGPGGALGAALFGALAGGVLALAVSVRHNYTGTAFRNLGTLLRSWLRGGVRPVEGMTLRSSGGPRLPYAVPLAVGAVMAAWLL